MFQIKICGITRAEDLQIAAKFGADALGLNCYPKSKRYVNPSQAELLAQQIPNSIAKVGVFVNAAADEIKTLAKMLSLDWIQLHGNEPPEFLTNMPTEIQILRAFRIDNSGIKPVRDYLTATSEHGRMPDAILLDGFAPGEFGGTGQRIAWDQLIAWKQELPEIPMVLAGGLTPENVAEAIRTSDGSIVAVDTASGVESAPGIKDPVVMQKFIANAQAAFDALQ